MTALGPISGALFCVQERHYGTDDTSNIMGYDNVLSCFNLPQSEAIGLASAKRYGPTRLPAGKKINLRLKPLWGPNPQVWVGFICVYDAWAATVSRHGWRLPVHPSVIAGHEAASIA